MENLKRRALYNNQSDGILLAVGIADYEPDIDQNVSAILERADTRMYQKKKELKTSFL